MSFATSFLVVTSRLFNGILNYREQGHSFQLRSRDCIGLWAHEGIKPPFSSDSVLTCTTLTGSLPRFSLAFGPTATTKVYRIFFYLRSLVVENNNKLLRKPVVPKYKLLTATQFVLLCWSLTLLVVVLLRYNSRQ